MQEPETPTENAPQETDSTSKYVTEAARGMYQEARDWYKVAETKAQILFALDGAAVTAISSVMIGNPQALMSAVSLLPWYSLAALQLAFVAFFASVLCAIWAVSSNVYLNGEVDKRTERGVTPSNLWFFQFHTRHKPDEVLASLREDRLAEARALLSNLKPLAISVTSKHRAVNWGFGLAGSAVTLVLAAAAMAVISLSPAGQP